MAKDLDLLKINLKSVVELINHNKHTMRKVGKELLDFNISLGDTQRILNSPKEEISRLDARELCLFTDALYRVSGDRHIQPERYFTEREIKEAKTTYFAEAKERLTFPYTFHNVIKVADDDYITTITGEEIKRMQDSGLLQYNPETQRESRLKLDKNTNQIVPVPKLNSASVREISDLAGRGELISSVLTFNARLGTSETGEELYYDPKSNMLTVSEGTLLDCMDGFHRVTGIVSAITQNPEIEMKFKLNILNYDTRKAQAYFSQMNKVNPVSKSRLKELDQDSLSSFVAKQIQINSELRGKVVGYDYVSQETEFIVSFGLLADTIAKTYKVKNKIEAIDISKYLTEFFNTLAFSYPEAFITDIVQVKKESLINANQMFHGYVVLAKRLRQQNISLSNLKNILDQIDFSRKNPMWADLRVLNEKGQIRNRVERPIRDLFENLELKGV